MAKLGAPRARTVFDRVLPSTLVFDYLQGIFKSTGEGRRQLDFGPRYNSRLLPVQRAQIRLF